LNAAGTSTGLDVPEAVTVQLPRLEDFAEDFDRAGRMMEAADLAGELIPEAFAQWMEQGRAIKAQGKGEAPNAQAGEHVA